MQANDERFTQIKHARRRLMEVPFLREAHVPHDVLEHARPFDGATKLIHQAWQQGPS